MSLSFRVALAMLVVLVANGSRLASGQTQASQPGPQLDGAVQLMLIRNTLTLVNHGNLTGNYTVLRDLASAEFRQRNTAADLSATFAGLRKQRLDLSPVLVTQPQLTQLPEIVGGRMQLAGIFPTRPQAVEFALTFQQVEAGWMIYEVSLRVAPAETGAQPSLAKREWSAAEYRPTAPNAPRGADQRTADRNRSSVRPATRPR